MATELVQTPTGNYVSPTIILMKTMPWIYMNKIYIPKRENKNTKINKNVPLDTENIFGLGGFGFLGAKNDVLSLVVLLLV